MKLKKIVLLNLIVVLFLLLTGANAAEKNIVDDANVLKQDTINTVDENLSEINKDKEVIVKINLIKSLDGESIDDYSKEYAKSNIDGEQFILFVTSIEDRKNKILVGEKADNILSKSDVENIVSLPNQDFKASNFDEGVIKISKALSDRIEPKTNYFKWFDMILFGLVACVMIVALFWMIMGGMDYDSNYRSNSRRMDNGYSYSKKGDIYKFNYNGNEKQKNSITNTTTIINNNNDNNRFVEGVMLGSIISDSSHNHSNSHHHSSDDTPCNSGSHSDYSISSWDSGSSGSSNDSSTSDW